MTGMTGCFKGADSGLAQVKHNDLIKDKMLKKQASF